MEYFISTSFINEFNINSSNENASLRCLNIELNTIAARSSTIMILDAFGRIHYEKRTSFIPDQKAKLDISDYSEGEYFLQVENYQGKTQTQKFVI